MSDLRHTPDMKTLKTAPIKESAERDRLAKACHLSVRQTQRWISFIKENSLDFMRCCPDGKTVPTVLHPYQWWLVTEVTRVRHMGKEWLAPILLKKDSKWSYSKWLQNHQDKTA